MKPKVRLSNGAENESGSANPGGRQGWSAAARASVAGEDFWQAALALYARPKVAPHCLVLQDRFGFDVMLLLFCCFVGSQGRQLDRFSLGRLTALVQPWRETLILPLRRRRRAAAGRRAERDRLLAAEIAAEYEEARLIGRWLAGRPLRRAAPATAVALSLMAYGALTCSDEAARPGLARLAAWVSAYSRLSSVSPQRRTRPVSIPKRSSTRPTV